MLIASLYISAQSLLVCAKTNGYRHESIAAGKQALLRIAQNNGMTITFTEDSLYFSRERLAHINVIIFLHTSGDILDDPQQQAMEQFIASGGGFVGVHSASATEYDWPWYTDLLGNVFDQHPKVQPARLKLHDDTHAITDGLPAEWTTEDEWYNFQKPFDAKTKILITLDESSYEGGTMGEFHPISWHQTIGDSRSFYTALGHTAESFKDPNFVKLLTNGLNWVLDTQ